MGYSIGFGVVCVRWGDRVGDGGLDGVGVGGGLRGGMMSGRGWRHAGGVRVGGGGGMLVG